MTVDRFWQLALQSLRDPRAAGLRVMQLNWPVEALLMLLGIVVATSGLLTALQQILLPQGIDAPLQSLRDNPLIGALVQGGGVLYSAALMTFLGRLFGGKGLFAQALALCVWIEVLLLAVLAAQLILMLAFPIVALLLGLLAYILLFWLVINFTAALHGFQNLFLVALGVIGGLFLSGVLFLLTLGLFNIAPPSGV